MTEIDKDIKDFEMMEADDAPAEEKKKKKDDAIYVSYFETEKHIYEQLSLTDAVHADDAVRLREGGAVFVKYNKDNEQIDYVNEFEHRGKKYLPIVDETMLKGGIILPSEPKEYKNTNEIVEQMGTFFHDNIELPSFYEKFLPNLVLFYWVYEKFPFIPYVQFVGRTATGKSTAMEVIGSVCYKPIDTTGSLTIASMFRIATTWKGTLLIDEFEQVGENSKEIVSFLKSGVSDRLVLRTEGDTRKEVKAYVVKAPKIFTSENPISDTGLQSRTIVIKMEKSKRKLPLFRLNHYYQTAMDIRNKLLLWRLRNSNKINLKEIEFGFNELCGFDRRVQQVITPIYYFSDKDTKKNILEFAKQQEIETKRERSEALDGKIFECIWENKDFDVTIGMIFDYINTSKNKKQITERKIGSVVRTILGFEIIKVGHDKVSTIVLENQKERLDELADYYGYKKETGQLSNVPHVTHVPQKKEKEDTYNINNIKDIFDVDN